MNLSFEKGDAVRVPVDSKYVSLRGMAGEVSGVHRIDDDGIASDLLSTVYEVGMDNGMNVILTEGDLEHKRVLKHSVGDMVRVVESARSDWLGSEGKVVQIDRADVLLPYFVEKDGGGGGRGRWFEEVELESVEPEAQSVTMDGVKAYFDEGNLIFEGPKGMLSAPVADAYKILSDEFDAQSLQQARYRGTVTGMLELEGDWDALSQDEKETVDKVVDILLERGII